MTWYAMDLHVHTPASADYQDEEATFLDILRKAEAEGLDIVGFTDHNTVAGYARLMEEIEDLERWEKDHRLRPEEKAKLDEYRRLLSKILLLPGFEFTATFGFHILALFDPATPIRQLEHLLLDLHVPLEVLDRGETEVGSTTDVLTAYRLLDEAGALVIAAHANSAHGVAMFGLSFGGQTRIAYTQDPHLHALEVTDLESRRRRTTASFFDGSKPQYPRRMHCIQGSDAHRLHGEGKNLGVGERATEVLLPERSFAALKQLFLSDEFSRTRPYRRTAEAVLDEIKVARQQGPTLTQAFHESMTRRGGNLHAILCDIAALANAKGGVIYVGVSPNPRAKPKGVENPAQAIKTLQEEMERLITPPLKVQFDTLTTEGVTVIRIRVPEGTEKPYAIEGHKIYIRREAETSLALRDEIVALVSRGVAQGEKREAPRARAPQAPSSAKGRPIPEASAPAERAEAAPRMPREAEPRQAAPADEEEALLVEPPRSGVEIDETVVRQGVQYHTMKDLRDGGRVHNVTRSSARRLWRYAIALKEKGAFSEDKVQWVGDLGLWHKYLRSGKPHYDLVQRGKNGKVHIYYGVSEEGLHGPWRAVVEKRS